MSCLFHLFQANLFYLLPVRQYETVIMIRPRIALGVDGIKEDKLAVGVNKFLERYSEKRSARRAKTTRTPMVTPMKNAQIQPNKQ